MRKAEVVRTTAETDIRVAICLDGEGKSSVSTGIPFMDHMLTLFAKHGLFDLEVCAKGDLETEISTIEGRVNICLAFCK